MKRPTCLLICLWACVLVSTPTLAQPTDHAALAQRFRPYYKFSTEPLRGAEGRRPCSWEWLVARSELRLGDQLYVTTPQLAQEPRRILQQSGSDIRQARDRNYPFTLDPPETAYEGQPWSAVINDGAGLYAQVEEIGGDLVLIVYWTLYAYNLGTGGVAFEHEGDITAVSIVYDRSRDMLIRASFVIHGAVVESFDLQAPESRQRVVLRGVNAGGRREAVDAQSLHIAPGRRYQDGPSWHSPSPSEIYFVRDPSSGRYDHLALFIEWGAHEAWPNAGGSVIAAPKHNGAGVSFLPARVRFVGSASAPVQSEEPFLFFNGRWGDPPSPAFHPIFYDRRSPGVSTLGIPNDQFVDRDPYWEGGLPWPPPRYLTPARARISVTAVGDRAGSQVAIRWGHPDFNDSEYFPLWTIARGQTRERTFDLPDAESEFEIQTEGGRGTGYVISIWIDHGDGMPSQASILLQHNISGIRDAHTVNNNVSATRSSDLNQYGEQNIRVDTSARVPGTIR